MRILTDSGTNNLIFSLNGTYQRHQQFLTNTSGAITYIGGEANNSSRRFHGNISDELHL